MNAEHAAGSVQWQREAERIGRLVRQQHAEFLCTLIDYRRAVECGDFDTCYAATNAACASLRRMLLVLDAHRESFRSWRASSCNGDGDPGDVTPMQATPWPSVPGGLDDLIAETQRLLGQMCTLRPPDLRTTATNLRILSNYAEASAERQTGD